MNFLKKKKNIFFQINPNKSLDYEFKYFFKIGENHSREIE